MQVMKWNVFHEVKCFSTVKTKYYDAFCVAWKHFILPTLPLTIGNTDVLWIKIFVFVFLIVTILATSPTNINKKRIFIIMWPHYIPQHIFLKIYLTGTSSISIIFWCKQVPNFHSVLLSYNRLHFTTISAQFSAPRQDCLIILFTKSYLTKKKKENKGREKYKHLLDRNLDTYLRV